ncbi:Do family serine endopeptidase [Pontiella sulfatireligans]|uniref:Periplasmic serine endoprotease DegP n=1 Tax=Pontiella sulfatireligans TaxID=2750658 RepID=A0A6C2UUT3_9BACT|nr:Do family serine endopeptidase [Pontiella sulfatireligans]VGO22924.1 Periplasmic serine endoprotease DegP [Pontiella sulfatireligans]
MRTHGLFLAGIVAAASLSVNVVEAGKINVLKETGSAFSQIAKEALPAVVFVDVETVVEVPQRAYRQNPFEEFFGGGRYRSYGVPEEAEPRKYSQQGQGSGFIISKDGYILTNNHVVKEADRITVTLGDGRKFDATMIGTDPKSEVALIKIEDGEDLPCLELGDSDALEVGEWVLAAGNPFGLSQTVTAGIVSAKGRAETGIAEYGNFIQTDAAINPGNSGGPLLNIDGKVVGINTAIYTRTGGYMGIGFAIPVNQAIQIKDQLIKFGKVTRSILGVFIQEVDEDLAKSFGLEESGGILISQVVEGSAAEEAGIEGGDIVVEIEGVKAGKVGAFRNRVASIPPNTKIDLKIFRDGKYKHVSAITKEMEGADIAGGDVETEIYDKLGLTAETLDADGARQLGVEGFDAVVVTKVEQGGAAWRAGLTPGQLITSVNRRPVADLNDFKEALAASEDTGRVLLLVNDGRSSRFVVVTLD